MTRTIAGIDMTLTEGIPYLATSPMGTNIVHITNMITGVTEITLTNLTYEARCNVLNGFNDGTISFDGRVWE